MQMRTIKFNPLRVIKKTGKITVASYLQWRKVKTSDYNEFNLIIDESYKLLNDGDFVYKHDGEQLFFYSYDPCKVPILVKMGIDDELSVEWKIGNNFIICHKGTIHSPEDWFTFRMDGTDCDGVPTFSHYDIDRVGESNYITLFEPLTVGLVKKWFGWFLWSLENSRLKTKP
jgi:hypothetical protein